MALVTPGLVTRPNTHADVTVVSGTAFEIDSDNKDLVLIMTAAAASVVTFTKGDGIQAANDLLVNIGAGDTVAIHLDTGSFQMNSGANANKIVATATTSVDMIAVAR